MPDPGKFRHRIIIQRVVRTTGAGGQPKVYWADYARRWADCRVESAKERVEHDTPESQTRWKIVLRYDAGIDETMRIVHGNATIQISGRPSYDDHRRHMYIAGIEER